jgi:hypothetical protein
MNTKPVCNFNCICFNSDCNYRHYVTYKERKIIAKIYNDELTELKTMKEEKSETRKANCIYGQLCKNKDCNFKHHINYEGRMMLIEKYNTNSTKKNHTNEEKSVKIINIKKSDFKSKNLFDDLEEEKEEEKKEIIFPIIVIINKLDESKPKWTDVVKNGEHMILEKKKNNFEKMMTVEKSAWADYDDE